MPPAPDDTFSSLAAWELLASDEGAPLVAAALEAGEPTPAVIGQLRRDWPVAAVTAAVELARARARAHVKFPGRDRLWCDVSGLEQASSMRTANWKQLRFERAGATSIADLCCGIGGDAMALARGGDLLAVDLDPVRAWMAGANAGCPHLVADVLGMDDLPDHVHIDPARRDGTTGRRAWTPDAYEPRLDDVLGLLEGVRGGACKLGPGIPLPLPGRPDGSELEFIQEGGRLVQSVLWTGSLAEHPGERTATMLPEDLTVSGLPGELPLAEVLPEEGAWLIEPEPALERSGLCHQVLGALDVVPEEIAPGLGLLQAGEPARSPWFTDWRIAAVLPLREKAIRSWLRDHDAGEVIVRTRGGAVEVDRWAKRLRGTGSCTWVVFGLRLGKTTRAIIVHSAD
ncbi:MAG: hypothetical protein MK082_03560 [Phycisphaerales bacterium]|nr:hypothetical protein [Phycisphaerales bacterium]